MKRLLVLALIPATVLASECVLQDRTVSRSAVTIAERSRITPEVVSGINAGRKCMVTFRVRIGADWHSAHGEYEWAGDRPREEACAVAVSRADDEVRARVGRSQSVSEKTMICSDRPDLDALRSTNPELWLNYTNSDRIQIILKNFGIMVHLVDTFWTVHTSVKMCAHFKE